MNTAKSENRQYIRINIFNHVFLNYRGVFLPGVARNMSPEGILVDLRQPPRVLPVDLRLYIHTENSKTLILPAQVAHVTGKRVGLKIQKQGMLDAPLYTLMHQI
jgi:hypothetical protein